MNPRHRSFRDCLEGLGLVPMGVMRPSLVEGNMSQFGGYPAKESDFKNPRIFIEMNRYPSVFWGIIAMEFRVDFSR